MEQRGVEEVKAKPTLSVVPPDGLMLLTPKEGQRFYRSGITITAVAERGATVQLSVNGQYVERKMTVSPARFPEVVIDTNAASAHGLTVPSVIGVWSFIDQKLQPGPNQITVKVTSGNYDGVEVTRNVHIIGPPQKITISAVPKRVRADGISTSAITITLTDEWGESVPDGIYFVTIDPGLGKLMPSEEAPGKSGLLDAQPGTPGIQLPIKGGKAIAKLGPSLQTGETEITASYNSIKAKTKIQYIPILPPSWAIAALATGKLTNFETEDEAGKLTADLGEQLLEDSDLFYDKRAAIFLKGPIYDRLLLTGAYDSEKKPYRSVERDRIFRQLEPDKLYSIYGDSSSLFYEAQSSAKGYLKLEKGKSWGLFGDYNTNLSGDSELAAYERSLTGAKIHLDEPNFKFVGVSALTKQSLVRQEIVGKGTSGFYYLEKAPVVQLSEKVQIEVRDRFHSEKIIRVEQKHRYIDYDIDYEQGTILFKQPVPSRDGNYNPVYIVVHYESVEPVEEEKDYIAALHGELKGEDENSGLAAMVGGTLIKEGFDKNANAFELFQLQAFHGRLATRDNKATIYGEFAQSEYQDKKGEGWKAEANIRPTDSLALEAYYRDIGEDFFNPSSLQTEYGTKKYGASLDFTPPVKDGQLHAEHYRSKQNILTTGSYLDAMSSSLGYQHKLERLTFSLEVEHLLQKDRAKRDSESLLGIGRVDLELIPNKLVAHLQRDQNFLKEDQLVNYKPDATSLGLSYKITDNITTYASHKILDPTDDESFVDRNSTVIGVRSQLLDNLTAFSEYRIGNVISGETNQASIGLRNRLRLTPDVAVNIAAERRRRIDELDAGGDFDALSLSAEYLPVDIPVKTTGKYEIRKDSDAINDLAEVGIDFKITTGFSFIGKNRFYREIWRARPEEPRFIKNHTIAGIALRPESTNIINALAKIDVKYDDNAPQDSTLEQLLANKSLVVIASTDLIFHPIRQVELYGKYAIRWRQEEDFNPDPNIESAQKITTKTDLYISRLRLELNNYIDVAGEYRLLYEHAIDEFKHGASTELGFWFIPNLRTAIGYNFLGTNDQDKGFPESKYWARGPFVRLSVKY